MVAWPTTGMRQRLSGLRETTKALRELTRPADLVVEQSLARYLTVRAAGYVEAIRDDAADLHSFSRAPIEVVRRIRHHLRTGQGVTPGQLIDFVGSFSPDWSLDLRNFLDANDEILKGSLGSMVAARKKIAHGDGDTVTTGRALAWSRDAEKIGGWVIQKFDPN